MSPDSDMRRLRGRTAASKIALMAWNVQLLGRVAARLLPAERMAGLGTEAVVRLLILQGPALVGCNRTRMPRYGTRTNPLRGRALEVGSSRNRKALGEAEPP